MSKMYICYNINVILERRSYADREGVVCGVKGERKINHTSRDFEHDKGGYGHSNHLCWVGA